LDGVMPDLLEKIKPRVRGLKAYTLKPDRGAVKLNQNENPWGVPEAVRAETLRRMERRQWARYPDFVPASLHEKLAAFAGWRADGVVAGNGSNELIQATLMVTVGEGKRVLMAKGSACSSPSRPSRSTVRSPRCWAARS
jgi:histidinol-phosphate aminotransferase